MMSRVINGLRQLEQLSNALEGPAELEMREVAPGVWASPEPRRRRRVSRLLGDLEELRQLHRNIKTGFDAARVIARKKGR